MPLSSERKLQIRQKAEETLLRSGVGKGLPINTEAVAAYLGYTVRAFMPDRDTSNISGAVDYEGKVVFINGDEPPTRQHFTLAHEIGHIALHEGKTVVDFRDAAPHDEKEQEANAFAAALLLPSDLFYLRWIESGGNTKEMGRTFGVSEEAIRIRAQDLKLL